MKPLHLIVEKDPQRKYLNYIYVMNGFVYVVNGSVLLKLPTAEVFGDVVFEEEEVLLFEADMWNTLKFHKAKIIVREGLTFKNLTIGTSYIPKTPKEAEVQVPNFDALLPAANKPVVPCTYISFNPQLAMSIAKAIGAKDTYDLRKFTYQFYGTSSCIEVFYKGITDMKCIMMPVLLDAPTVKEPLEAPKSTEPTNTVPATKGTIGEVLEIVDKYKEVKHAILSDYLMEDGLVTELNAAIDNMVTSINEIEVEEEPLPDEDEKNNTEPSLDDFSEEDILDHLREKDFSIIKIDNLADKIKLETFIENDLYPLYADRLSKTSL